MSGLSSIASLRCFAPWAAGSRQVLAIRVCRGIWWRSATLAGLLCAVALAAGCGAPSSTGVDAAAPGGSPADNAGAETPEQCLVQLKEAAEQQDMGLVFDSTTERSQDALAGMMAAMGNAMKMMGGLAALAGPEKAEKMEQAVADVEALLAKHQVPSIGMEQLQAMNDPAQLAEMAASIQDKRAFVVELAAIAERVSQGEGAGMQTMARDLAGKLENLQIEGEQAVGRLVGESGSQPIVFEQTESGWKLDLLGMLIAQVGRGPAEPSQGDAIEEAGAPADAE